MGFVTFHVETSRYYSYLINIANRCLYDVSIYSQLKFARLLVQILNYDHNFQIV